MIGKVCLITGANSGIGKETVLGLAKMRATVVMLCRDRSRGERALAEIKEKSHNENVELMIADLSEQNSIRIFVSEFTNKFNKLDLLINNAGVGYLRERTATRDGIETTFAVNYLAPFLLTNLLLDLLKKSSRARIVNVAGMMHNKAPIQLDDLQFENNYDPMKVGSHSKLALIMFTYELSRRLEGTGVVANCLHPGAVRTNIQKGLPWHLNWMVSMVRLFFLSPEKGAEASIYIATSPELEGVSGKYFNGMKESRSSPESFDETIAEQLWEKSAELCGLDSGG
jgi:NAD(P)-dependent dehydrogenase (short-subunit alcohol dehydrogenase family)